MKAEDSIHSLREYLNDSQTGCLTHQDGGSHRVFLMQGEILAAHGPDDDSWVVQRLVNNGTLTEGQGRQVVFYLGQGYRLEELLLDQVPDQQLMELLSARFRQNLLEFSLLSGPLAFETMDAIFVDNLQVGHDSLVLLNEIEQLRTRIAPIRMQLDQLMVQPGPTTPRAQQEAQILALCPTPTSLQDVVAASPWEEGPTLDIIQRMVTDEMMLFSSASPQQQQPAAPTDNLPASEDLFSLVDEEEEEEEGDDPFFNLGTDDADSSMGLFEDNDHFRGGGQGQFTVSRDLLDRVDLNTPMVESKTPEANASSEMIELDDAENMDEEERATAHSLSFGPPPLDIYEQRRKVSVCNEVLTELTQSLDMLHGPGSGRAFIQLLLDGTPHQYSVLFMGVEIDSAGCIDTGQVVKNLQRQPPRERRRLINLGSLNLIDRALSAGAEELNDDMMDALLQRVAGYQMRIGL